MKKKHIYTKVALLMAGILAVCAVLVALMGNVLPQDGKTVVTTVYPLYVAARNIIGTQSSVQVKNLTGAATGCLHDYQLSPDNRILLEKADLILLNGAGAEPFLEDVLPKLTATVVDTAAGLDLLGAAEHEHEDEHEHEYNEHVWMSPTRYAAQVRQVIEGLCTAFPAEAAGYRQRGEAYLEKIEQSRAALEKAVSALSGCRVVTFHESLSYLAADLGMVEVASLTVGEEAGVSAADLAAVQRILQEDPSVLLLYDDQYTVRYAEIDRLLPSTHVLALKTGVKGEDWLDAMAFNRQLLERVAEENK